ncbi:MAG: 3' terminal RNA ribose 2'-O-methyltransferase Hen1 [Propioniciclava sp.]
MLLTLTLTGPHADRLGYLLHKHPDRVQTFSLAVGQATVFYPESTPERSTAALLLEVDPIGMVKRRGRNGLTLTDYVTDRPYAASSFFAVALGRVFSTALNGRCDAAPDLPAADLPWEIRIPALPAAALGEGSGATMVRRLFEPLGWTTQLGEIPFGPEGAWGVAPYVNATLSGTMRLADALSHVYVLLPVLDDAKHYWVGPDEVTKLIRRGGDWLATHPEQDLITRRYLRSQRDYVADATDRLSALEDSSVTAEEPPDPALAPLKVQRRSAVVAILHEVGAHRVVDLGCGEGYVLAALLPDPSITELVGADVAPRALQRAERRLNLDRLPDQQRAKLTLRQSAVTYRDDHITGFDAILLVEVIEHLDPDRIDALERNLFGTAQPQHLIVTTPNREYNQVYGMAEQELRHPDHRFEWTRAEFQAWAHRVGATHGYAVDIRPVGAADPDAGSPTQLALFSREVSA